MVKFLVNNAETLSKQEKEGCQKKETTGGGGDSQEGATSEFKKILDVEKTSKQDEPAQEEVKSLAPLVPLGLGWWSWWWWWPVAWLLKR